MILIKNSRKVILFFTCLLILYLCFFPIPLRVHREMDALFYPCGADEPQPCTISINGVRFLYLFRQDQYDGTFAISLLPETSENGARLETFLGNKTAGPMWYNVDHPDDSILNLGYVAASADFSWFYIYLTDDSFLGQVIAPTSMDYEAMHTLLEEKEYLVPSVPTS